MCFVTQHYSFSVEGLQHCKIMILSLVVKLCAAVSVSKYPFVQVPRVGVLSRLARHAMKPALKGAGDRCERALACACI